VRPGQRRGNAADVARQPVVQQRRRIVQQTGRLARRQAVAKR
jgi:hypothetical protein